MKCRWIRIHKKLCSCEGQNDEKFLGMGLALPDEGNTQVKSYNKRLVIGCFVAIMALSGCAQFAAWLRQYTYPPDFNYISREQLRSTMWRLARDMRELETTLREPGEFDEPRRAQINRLLISMEENAAHLNRSGRASNHPVIDANLPALLRDIQQARKGVESRPPNYALAGFLPGACIYCHGGESQRQEKAL
jgi:hypothetical protein